MFIMSGDSTNEWYRYLSSGCSGWSILNDPPPLLSVPVTTTLPEKCPASPVGESDWPHTPIPLPLVGVDSPSTAGPFVEAERPSTPAEKPRSEERRVGKGGGTR